MRNSGWPFRVVAVVGVLAGPCVSAEVRIHPIPTGLSPSDRYGVEVLHEGSWQPVFVFKDEARTQGAGFTDLPGRSFHWATFETGGPVRLRVTRKSGPAATTTLRPLRHAITAKLALAGFFQDRRPGLPEDAVGRLVNGETVVGIR